MNFYDVLLAKKLGGGGITPTGKITITQNGNGIDVAQYAEADVNVPNPSTGNINITSMSQVDVTNYATAQVVDADLVAGNIKKDVDILGIVGTYEGGGGGDEVLASLIDGSVTSLEIPTGVTSVKEYAFFRQPYLEEVVFPEGVITIGELALQNCPSLTKVELPTTITSIGAAFVRLYNMTTDKKLEITIKATTPPTIGTNFIGGRESSSRIAIYVPAEAVYTYQNDTSHGWYEVNDDFIQAIPT